MSLNQNGQNDGPNADQSNFNTGGMITFVLSMIASFAVMIYVSFLSGGVDLKEVKEQAAAPAATQAKAAEAPIDVSAVKDPWMESDQMIGRGKQLFAQNCAMCHGATGGGDGPAGASLNPKPRNMIEGKWKLGGTRLGLYGVLHNGIPGSSMQSYKHLPKNDRWALIHFVRSITKNKVADKDAEVAAQAPKLD